MDHMVNTLVFLRNFHTVSIVVTPIYILTNSVLGLPFPISLSTFIYITFDDRHSDSVLYIFNKLLMA